jgi:hypothetical protein
MCQGPARCHEGNRAGYILSEGSPLTEGQTHTAKSNHEYVFSLVIETLTRGFQIPWQRIRILRRLLQPGTPSREGQSAGYKNLPHFLNPGTGEAHSPTFIQPECSDSPPHSFSLLASMPTVYRASSDEDSGSPTSAASMS